MSKKFKVRNWLLFFCSAVLTVPPAFSQANPTVQRVAVLGSERGIQVKITSNQPVPTQTQLLTGPDRLVIDFPGAAPGSQLRGLIVNQGGIKGVRVGLFAATPPTTRVVVDLAGVTPYQIVPDGNSVLLKLGNDGSDVPGGQPSPGAPVSADTLAAAAPPPPSAPHVQVNFHRGELTVHADKATLAEVLFAIQQRTGADIPIPAGAEQEQVVADAGPGPAKDVLTALLTGTNFNFIVVGSDQNDGSLRSVILSPKTDLGNAMPAGMQPVNPVAAPDQDVPDVPQEQVQQLAPPTTPPPPPLQPGEVPGAVSGSPLPPPGMNQGPSEQPPQNMGQPAPDENNAPPDEPQ